MSAPKIALITGITGQDGSYLAEFLLSKGYVVHGIIRRSSSFNTGRIDHLFTDPKLKSRFMLHYGDLSDGMRLREIVETVRPHEVYNLAAQSHVKVSFQEPCYTCEANITGTLNLLECVRTMKEKHPDHLIKMYQAGTSEMFGGAKPPQSEATVFEPRSPYAISKVACHMLMQNYREAYGLFLCNGILFNHESPRRGETFVTRKITRALARIKLGLQDKLVLGNLDAKRDWGFAGDYVEGMWMMMQQSKPDDFVIATGESHSVREFLDICAERLELGDWTKFVVVDERYFRPTEVDFLQGNATKSRNTFGWTPKTSFNQLVKLMIDHDMRLAEQEKNNAVKDHRL